MGTPTDNTTDDEDGTGPEPGGAPSVVRIFLSSPGDVVPERDTVSALVESLNLSQRDGVRIELIRWEDSYYTADSTFQDQIVSPAACDLVILILWSRIGTELAGVDYQRADGSPYRSGTEYEFEAAIEAARRTGRPDVFVYRKTAPPQIAPDDEAGNAQWRDLQAFWSRWFVDGQGHFVAAHHDFASVDAFEHKIGQHLRQWLHERRQIATITWPESKGSPFRGLEAFDAEHAAVYFGRRAAIGQALRRLRHAIAAGCGFLLVIGRSGVGKSSFVRAGLVPALQRGEAGQVGDALTCIVRGDDGCAGVMAAIAGVLGNVGPDAAGLADVDPEDGVRAVAAALRAEGGRPARRLILVADQFEGLFGLPRAEQDACASLLAGLAHCPDVVVIATLRVDFYRQYQDHAELVALKDDGVSFDLLPPTKADISDIIRGPAAAAGLQYDFDPATGNGLDDVLLEATNQADALPLLEFTLDELYKRRQAADGKGGSARLTFAAYRELGGLEGAIAERADAEFALLDPAAQAALPAVLRAAVTTAGSDGDRFIQQPMPLSRFAPGTSERRLIDRFADPRARLMVTVTQGGQQIVRLAHEALLTHWPRAVAQLERDRQLIVARARLTEQANRWHNATAERDSLLLPPGLPLSEAEAVLDQDGASLPPDVVAYIKASSSANVSRLEQETAIAKRAARRARIALVVITLLGLTTAAGAGVGFRFWQQAEEQAELAQDRATFAEEQQQAAEENQALAIDAINILVSDVVDRLRNVAGVRVEVIVDILGKAEAMLAVIEERTEEPPDMLRHRQATMHWSFSRSYQRLGEVGPALASAELARSLLEDLVADPDAPLQWRADLIRVIQHQGNIVMTQEDPLVAASMFRDAVERANALVEVDPDTVEWQRALSSSHMYLGDALLQGGAWEEGRAELAADLAISEALYDADPDNPTLARDLEVSLGRQATILQADGRLTDALEMAQRVVELAEQRLANDPDNTATVADVTHSYDAMGGILLEMERLVEAFDTYQRALEINLSMMELDPGDTGWQRAALIDYESLGEVSLRRGDLEAALEFYRLGLELQEDLSASDPGNIRWQRDLLISLFYKSYVLDLLGEYEEAREVAAERLRLARELVTAYPDVLDLRRDLSVSLETLGDRELALGNLEEARALYEESLAIVREMVELQPQNGVYINDLAFTLLWLSEIQLELGDGDAALASLDEAVQLSEQLVAENPGNVELQRDLSVMYAELGATHLNLENLDEALAAYEQDMALAQEILAQDPDNMSRQRDVALSHQTLADVYYSQGRLDAALEEFEAALRIFQTLHAAPSDSAQWHIDLINTHYWMALVEIDMERTDDALANLGKARALVNAYLEDRQDAGEVADFGLELDAMIAELRNPVPDVEPEDAPVDQ